jgi:hypothetical protein
MDSSMKGPLIPRLIDPQGDKRWDEFVTGHPQGDIYHLSSWGEVLSKAYGFSPYYIALERSEGNGLEGGIPFMAVNSRVTGRRLVSLPLTSYCSLLMPKEELPGVIGFAREKCPTARYALVKLLERETSGGESRGAAYTTHILDLKQPPSELFRSFHGSSIRQRIKRAKREGLTFRLGTGERDLKSFYGLETMVRKKHGLPPQPYAFFLNLWRIMYPKNLLSLPLVEHGGRVVAGAVVLRFKETTYFEYSASDQRFLKLCPNQMLIWECIKRAMGMGSKSFDFGRTALSNPSLMAFKERWNARRFYLDYRRYPESGESEGEPGRVRRFMEYVNRSLPPLLLRLEGRLIYPHIS